MKSGASTLVFAFNHGNEPVDATITGIAGRARDLETGERLEILQHRFKPQDVWVVELRPSP